MDYKTIDDKITPIRKSILERTKTRDNRKAQLQGIEDSHYIDILNESKDREFAKEHNLSNERGRAIALKERLSYDDDYQLLSSNHEILCVEVESLSIELERERNRFKIWYVEMLRDVGDKI